MSMLQRSLSLLAILALPGLSQAAYVATWDGASGHTPDQVSWDLNNTDSHSPSFAGGVLSLHTGNSNGTLQTYSMSGADLDQSAGSGYWMEASMRFGSGSYYPGWARSNASMGVTFANGMRSILHIRADRIFLLNGDNSIGANSTSIDTDDAFHTYRMEIDGTAAHSMVRVYQDNVLVLSDDAVFYNGAATSRVWFGDGTTLAYGTSDWTSVSHNMAGVSAVPEPSSLALMAGGLLLLGARRRRAR
jgi:PEP-CTERM motif